MKQAITLFLGACALLAAVLPPGSRAEGVITLKSGEKLPGSLDTLDSPYLKVRSSILSKPVDVNLEELDELVSSLRWRYRSSFPSSGSPTGTSFTAP